MNTCQGFYYYFCKSAWLKHSRSVFAFAKFHLAHQDRT